MRVCMVPDASEQGYEESGIRRVVEAYSKYLPSFGVELVGRDKSYDLSAAHAGAARGHVDVAHTHGLYWTGDYGAANWEWAANAVVIENCRYALMVTVPSEWVAETFRRDMHLSPVVLGHGIDLEAWGEPASQRHPYVLWNKNRTGDVCNPAPVNELAARRRDLSFVTTFATTPADNIKVTGRLPHTAMKRLVKEAGVYLATTKETFGIGTLEAMASGVPVLGFRHGGVLDMVQHGVHGYLAEPGDYDDLAAGLAYCLEHNAMLGENGRIAAAGWTWEKAVERVARAYARALEAKREPPTVGIVIPTYKYGDVVGRAVRSALAQTYPLLTRVVVVDDGTPDDGATERAVMEAAGGDKRVLYVRQENAGVAVARNTGVSLLDTKYACCLDADDEIAPLFLERCIAPLEGDRSIGLAYTGLMTVLPDGTERVSSWPGAWNFDQQTQRRNQVPTCNVFRRSLFNRLGGFRQRYSPKGAGAEDAELWLRMGAAGAQATQATEEPLFRYRFMSGQVSGDRHYREVDWLGWHPWAGTPQRSDPPFASFATVKRFSHPVRAYDEPAVSVVIPVGRGHADTLLDALDSMEAQTFAKWECIVVDDSGEDLRARYEVAFPWVRWVVNEGHSFGAGYSRNRGAEVARAPFLTFLDADDWLYPEALAKMLAVWDQRGEIVFTDYVGKAQVDDVKRLAPDLQKRVYTYDERTKQAVIGYRSAEYDCERACRQPEGGEPYLWCNVTCLIPKAWHDEAGGFDERLKTWEDVEYHWRLAKMGRCYVRLAEELMVYRFGTGMRRQLGLQTYPAVVEYIREKHRGLTVMGCGCKGGNAQVQTQASAPLRLLSSTQEAQTTMADSDIVLVRYLHPNRGQHKVVGATTKTNYGFRAGGDTFLVRKSDIEAQPHLFSAIEKPPTVTIPARAPAPPPPPPAPLEQPVVKAKPKPRKKAGG